MDIYAQLERDEGRRLFPYMDQTGNLTIGVGHNLTANGLTNHRIDQILRDDVADISAQLTTLSWFAQLDPVRQAAIVNMAFNMGFLGLLEFHRAISFLESKRYDDAADEVLNSKWAAQVGIRAVRIAAQIRTGVWDSKGLPEIASDSPFLDIGRLTPPSH